MGIYDALHIGYSGLSASQSAINTTSHNISNANTPGYTKQRVQLGVKTPLHSIPGDVGRGVDVKSINRVHDEFVFSRFKSSSSKMEYNEFMKDTLTEITSYFPDINDTGIANDLKDFFNSWSNLAQNPSDSAQKVLVAQSANRLTKSIKDTRISLGNLQNRLDEKLKVAVDEVNKIGKEIASINKDINRVESGNLANANDLRDRRDELELRLNKLIDANVFKGVLHSNSQIDRRQTDQGTEYNINIVGRNLVDGATFHPLSLESNTSSADAKFSSVYYLSSENSSDKIDITSNIKGGRIGAIIALKGDGVDKEQKATNSIIQKYIDNLDDFAKGLKSAVNGIYASSPQSSMQSKIFDGANEKTKLVDIDGIKKGSFDIVVYDKSGKEVSRREIVIDSETVMDDPTNQNKNNIIYQINRGFDDNGDNDATNDIDDFVDARFGDRAFVIESKKSGYTVALEDKGSNFAGVGEFNRFFDGDDASTLKLNDDLNIDPTKIRAYTSPVDGDNGLANKMIALQNQRVDFSRRDLSTTTNTIEGFYRDLSSKVASDAASSVRNFDASEALNKTIKEQQDSVSQVDMDEELVSLMKFQSAYQANAKVISTIDKMLDTLLAIR